ncbi:MAG TPA: DUF6088 family protein [Acidimicrobiales bacterium]|nr:DUF6088 family protein [Acidimicrobiales bacterium]
MEEHRSASRPRGTDVQAEVLAKVRRAGVGRFWGPADFSGADADPGTIDRALSRLVDHGELHRVRRGLYWRGRRTPFGMTHPDELDVAARVAGVPGIGPAGIAAANSLGLSTQVAGRPSIAVPRRAPRPLSTFRFVDRSGRTGRIAQRLRPHTVALLEVLGDWDRVIEREDDGAWPSLVRLVQNDSVQADRLARAAATEPADVRVRLRNLLLDAGKTVEAGRVPMPRSTVDAA